MPSDKNPTLPITVAGPSGTLLSASSLLLKDESAARAWLGDDYHRTEPRWQLLALEEGCMKSGS